MTLSHLKCCGTRKYYCKMLPEGWIQCIQNRPLLRHKLESTHNAGFRNFLMRRSWAKYTRSDFFTTVIIVNIRNHFIFTERDKITRTICILCRGLVRNCDLRVPVLHRGSLERVPLSNSQNFAGFAEPVEPILTRPSHYAVEFNNLNKNSHEVSHFSHVEW